MKHRILDVPFAYNLKGMKKGQRKDRDFIRETSISVKIPCPTMRRRPSRSSAIAAGAGTIP